MEATLTREHTFYFQIFLPGVLPHVLIGDEKPDVHKYSTTADVVDVHADRGRDSFTSWRDACKETGEVDKCTKIDVNTTSGSDVSIVGSVIGRMTSWKDVMRSRSPVSSCSRDGSCLFKLISCCCSSGRLRLCR